MKDITELIGEYNDNASLEDAFTIPGSWYTHPEMLRQELRAVFGRTWQVVGRTEQLSSAGDYITAQVGNEPVLAVRGADASLKAFFNVCRRNRALSSTRAKTARQGDRAYYFWLYPNFMINVYEGVMDTNLVVPLSLAKTRVIFDFSSIKQALNMLRETPKASR
jgi:hypothetical protein